MWSLCRSVAALFVFAVGIVLALIVGGLDTKQAPNIDIASLVLGVAVVWAAYAIYQRATVAAKFSTTPVLSVSRSPMRSSSTGQSALASVRFELFLVSCYLLLVTRFRQLADPKDRTP